MLTRAALALFLAAAPAALHAQATVESGSRVRVVAPALADTALTGRVISIESGALLLAPRGGSGATLVPVAAIRGLEVARSREERSRRVTLWTSIAGAVAGYVLASPPWSGPCMDGCGTARLAGLVVGAGTGAVVGLVYTAGEPDAWIPARVRGQP